MVNMRIVGRFFQSICSDSRDFSETRSYFSVDILILKMPHIYFCHFSDLNLFHIYVLPFCMAGRAEAAPEAAAERRLRRSHMAAHLAARAGRMDGADLCRCKWLRGLRAAAAGCRRRHECQVHGACERGWWHSGRCGRCLRWIGVRGGTPYAFVFSGFIFDIFM